MKSYTPKEDYDSVFNIIENISTHLNQLVIVFRRSIEKDKDLEAIFINETFTKVTGYGEDFIGNSLEVLTGKDTSIETIKNIKNSVFNEEASDFEILIYTKKGSEIWAKINLIPIIISNNYGSLFIFIANNITREKELLKIAQEKESDIEFVLDSAKLGYWDLDLVENKTNRSLLHDQIFGHSTMQPDWSYETFLSHVYKDDKEIVDNTFRKALEDGEYYDVEFRCQWPDQSIHWLWSRGRFIRNNLDQPIRAAGIQADITEQKLNQQKIYDLAYKDELTKLPNRSSFRVILNQALKTSNTDKYKALLFLDIDDFKSINDTSGHQTGDLLLLALSKTISDSFGKKSTISRFGGDEFLVLINDLDNDKEPSKKIIENLIKDFYQRLQTPYQISNTKFRCRISTGITFFKALSSSESNLLKQADLALHKAKKTGKNKHFYFDTSLQSEAEKKVIIEHDLYSAITNNELFLVYQPKVTPEGKVLSMEALIRWKHPDKGIISPADFIPIAEESDLIIDLGKWVIEQAISFINRWDKLEIPSHCTLSINISPRHFESNYFADDFLNKLQKLKKSNKTLVIEITESSVISNLDRSIAKMEKLIQKGLNFSMDDFGSGYSSLSHLKEIPISEIKIDRSFIENIIHDEKNKAILEAIINIAERFKYKLVIEGVETKEQVDLLNSLGGKIYQGFYFSRPLSEEEAVKFISNS